jgi:hypothetical protein
MSDNEIQTPDDNDTEGHKNLIYDLHDDKNTPDENDTEGHKVIAYDLHDGKGAEGETQG